MNIETTTETHLKHKITFTAAEVKTAAAYGATTAAQKAVGVSADTKPDSVTVADDFSCEVHISKVTTQAATTQAEPMPDTETETATATATATSGTATSGTAATTAAAAPAAGTTAAGAPAFHFGAGAKAA